MHNADGDRFSGNSEGSIFNLKALVVEDEGSVALMIEDMLNDLGFEVSATAASLDEAIKVAESAIYDFAIIDINLRGEKAFPVAHVLRKRETPFIFSTGYGSSILPPEFQGCHIINKPFALEHLRIKVSDVLSKSAAATAGHL